MRAAMRTRGGVLRPGNSRCAPEEWARPGTNIEKPAAEAGTPASFEDSFGGLLTR